MADISYINFQDYNTLPRPEASSSKDIMENIDFLYKKIQACTRQNSYYDLYRISAVVSNPAELQAKINALSPYSSLVINTNVIYNDELYNIGDVIVKQPDNSYIPVKAQRGGIFYPSRIDSQDGSSYKITFEYSSVAPTANTQSETHINNSVNTLTETMVFTGLSSNHIDAPYNQIFTSDYQNMQVNAATKDDSNYIEPSVHAYFRFNNGQQEEEIFTEQKIVFDNNNKKYNISLFISDIMCSRVVVK